jgi:hypothetical protein
VSSYAGAYNGTFIGADSGSVYVGVGSEGTVIGISESGAVGSSGIISTMNPDGTFIGSIDGAYTTGLFWGGITGTSASGNWGSDSR